MNGFRRLGAVVLVAALATIVPSCSTDNKDVVAGPSSENEDGAELERVTDEVQPNAPEAAEPLFDFLRRRGENISRVATYTSLVRALPNVSYERSDGSTYRASELLVVGTVTSAEQGVGLVVGGDSDRVVEFESKDAHLVTVHATVDVESAYDQDGQVEAPPRTITFGLSTAILGTREQTLKAVASLGRVALLLRPSDVFAYTEGVFGVADGGEALITVQADETLTLPAADQSVARDFVETYRSLDALTQAASAPKSREPAPGPAANPPSDSGA
jgi:hypothetical protein